MSIPAASFDALRPIADREPVWHDPRADANRIKLSWMLRLHWGGIVGQTLAILAARWVLDIDVPLVALLALVGFEVAVNVALTLWLRSAAGLREGAIPAIMLFDTAVLTALLALSGGYSNPFSTMYLVNVALATVLLEAAWAWAILATSLACYASLFALDHVGALQILSSLEHEEILSLHMQGMWISFVVAAAFIVYIVGRVGAALTRMEEALAEERSLSARKDKVAALATLAAGAAHELSTPLSTIAVVVKELQLQAQRNAAPAGSQEDLQLIRDQVARCRDILHHMSAQAGENAGELIVSKTLANWVEDVLVHLPEPERVEVRAGIDLETFEVAGPPRGLTRALRGLLKNALQASPPDRRVTMSFAVDGSFVRVQVTDHGCGMEAEVLSRAGEPFFTTKAPGAGMGLGLFLTQTLAEQLGGLLELKSTPGSGTTATLTLPVAKRRSELK